MALQDDPAVYPQWRAGRPKGHWKIVLGWLFVLIGLTSLTRISLSYSSNPELAGFLIAKYGFGCGFLVAGITLMYVRYRQVRREPPVLPTSSSPTAPPKP